jgi:opacity protein-like surface antigen
MSKMNQRTQNKILIAILGLLSTSLTLASETENKPLFAGLYAGAGMGGIFSQYKTNSTTTLLYPSTAFFSSNESSTYNSSANFLVDLYAGYLFCIHKVYFGPEVYANIGKPRFSSSQAASAILPTESLTINTHGHYNTTEFGIDFRLGINATPTTLLYGVIGAVFNKLSINTEATIARPVILLATTTNNSSSFTETGLRLGAGLEQKLTPNLNLRINYIYTVFPSHSSSSNTAPDPSSPFFQLGPISNTTSISAHNHAIFATVVYQFKDTFLG